MLGHLEPGELGLTAIENAHGNLEFSSGLGAVTHLPNLRGCCCRRVSVLREHPFERLRRSSQSRIGDKKDIGIFAFDDYRSRDKRY